MLFFFSIVLFFVVTFVIICAVYALLVATGSIKKKRMEKVVRLVTIYSIFVTLIYIYQYLFI